MPASLIDILGQLHMGRHSSISEEDCSLKTRFNLFFPMIDFYKFVNYWTILVNTFSSPRVANWEPTHGRRSPNKNMGLTCRWWYIRRVSVRQLQTRLRLEDGDNRSTYLVKIWRLLYSPALLWHSCCSANWTRLMLVNETLLVVASESPGSLWHMLS